MNENDGKHDGKKRFKKVAPNLYRDAAGRYYVTSHVGIQMFDSTGRLGGVIEKPTSKNCASVAFAGPGLECLYACASDKIFRRKTKTKGVLFFQPPMIQR